MDIHRPVRPATLHLTGAHSLFRLILSEQWDRAPRMFQGLGVASAQMVTLSGVIAPAAAAGGAVGATAGPGRDPTVEFGLLAGGAGGSNVTKIAQRLPVGNLIDPGQGRAGLRPGMSVVVGEGG
ncbi:MAG: hypothetical protein ABS73_13660 [Paracoccus sp. SCN 68-21]|nr:MAG: hypothetical protein ABS73_13660 [Paracoccus sp. SCN 68-21]